MPLPEKSTVLIVDDESMGREALDALLKSQGYRLLFASSGAEALAKATECTPDLVLLDVMMPGMDGYETCRRFRGDRSLAEVPIIMLTALDDQSARVRGIEAGADEFLSKPFDRTELRARVATVTRLNRYRRLLLERSKLDQLIELSPDGIVIADETGTICLANPSALNMLKAQSHQAVLGRTITSFAPNEQKECVRSTLNSALTASQAILQETELIRFSGDRFPVDLAARAFPWEGKNAVQLSIRDLSEKKKLETQFLRAQRLQSIGTLAGGISHDLNNVLTPILVASQLLKPALTDPPSRRLIETIETSAQRGADVIKQILAFARGGEEAWKPLRVKYLLSEIEKICRETFPASIQIKSKLGLGLSSVHGNATQLHQVLMNLCVNARDAMSEGGTLRIEAEEETISSTTEQQAEGPKPGEYVKLSISDTGMGMSQEVLSRLFEPFFTTKELGRGTGLGLTTATSIVKNHGGFISVESEVGKGSRFRVYLPATAEAETSRKAEATESIPSGNGELVLVVDDEIAIVEIIRANLERSGYRVFTAHDGAEAVALYAQHKGDIQLVVTDSRMPYLDGTGLIRTLRRISPTVKLVVMTSPIEKEHLKDVPDLAELSFVLKPFGAETLLREIAHLLSQPR